MEERFTTIRLWLKSREGCRGYQVGIEKLFKAVSSDWVVFDNFSLSYYGSNVGVDDVTGISDVKVILQLWKDRVYDLSGRAIANPTRPGIYIVNGKKIVIH